MHINIFQTNTWDFFFSFQYQWYQYYTGFRCTVRLTTSNAFHSITNSLSANKLWWIEQVSSSTNLLGSYKSCAIFFFGSHSSRFPIWYYCSRKHSFWLLRQKLCSLEECSSVHTMQNLTCQKSRICVFQNLSEAWKTWFFRKFC